MHKDAIAHIRRILADQPETIDSVALLIDFDEWVEEFNRTGAQIGDAEARIRQREREAAFAKSNLTASQAHAARLAAALSTPVEIGDHDSDCGGEWGGACTCGWADWITEQRLRGRVGRRVYVRLG